VGSKTETTKKVLAWSVCDMCDMGTVLQSHESAFDRRTVCDMGTVLQSHESAFDRRTVPKSHKSQPFFLLNRIFSVVLDLSL
jgi:hypothetical protein